VAKIRPLARPVLTKDIDGELLVYNEEHDIACRLNRSAALVWQSSNGERTLADLVKILADELGGVADEDMVLMALDNLVDHDLIESGYERRDMRASRLSRRRFFQRVGVVGGAAMAAPVVYRMAVPSSAAAVPSYGGLGTPPSYTPYP
jgi:hypothetical protein